tara:strand:+ start:119 stop:484 length:366 start_codon:yes stop_codon:yes gene_type:complete
MQKRMVIGKGKKQITIDAGQEYGGLIQIYINGIIDESGKSTTMNLWFSKHDASGALFAEPTARQVKTALERTLYTAKQVLNDTQGWRHANTERLEAVYDQVGEMSVSEFESDEAELVEGGA